MFVPDDHVPAVYTNALPVASMATQKVSDTQETADNPCLAKWSTFAGADQAPDFAGAAVEAVLRLVLPPAVVEVDPVVELEPHAAKRSPANATANRDGEKMISDKRSV